MPDLRRTAATILATEPARVAEASRLAVAAAVTAAMVATPHRGVRAALAVVGLAASVAATSKVRASVTPVATLDGCAVVHDHDPATG